MVPVSGAALVLHRLPRSRIRGFVPQTVSWKVGIRHFCAATLLNRPMSRAMKIGPLAAPGNARWFVVDVDLGFIGIERPPEASP
jgi:hypothetical protein